MRCGRELGLGFHLRLGSISVSVVAMSPPSVREGGRDRIPAAPLASDQWLPRLTSPRAKMLAT